MDIRNLSEAEYAEFKRQKARELSAKKEGVTTTGEKLPFYQSLTKGDILYQIWEKKSDHTAMTKTRIIRGEIRPYTNWHDTPKEHWERMLSDGFIYYDIYPDEKAGRIIDTLTTKRRMGLGRSLVNIAEERMRHYGVRKIGGSAHASAIGARAFWSKLGFTFQDSEMQKVL